MLAISLIERFSNDCRKTKTKAITPTNHNRSRQRVACSAGGFWWGEWIYISIGCSGRQLDIVESWGEVKNLPSVGERKKNWGRGRGKKNPFPALPFSLPRPPPLRHSVILAPILPVCSESKIATNHSIDHQNHLHCRLTAR